MPPTVAGAVVLSAVLHATWNALLRGSADRRQATGWIGLATCLVCVPFLPFVGLPTRAWPYVLASAALNVLYLRLLATAYEQSELSFAYPIARGSSPLLVALGGALLASERLSPSSLSGVALISVGILLIGLDAKRGDGRALASALVIGLVIATYTVVDGLGARLCDSSVQYNAWVFSIYGSVTATRILPKLRVADAKSHRWALMGGVASVAAYGIVTWAMVLAPMGPVSALRETSSLFATLIGVVWLKERATPLRVAGCVGIVAGAACFALKWT